MDRFSKYSQISNFMKIRQLKLSCYMRTDGRTEMRTDRYAVADGRFRNFCERAHKVYLLRAFNWN